MNINIPILGLIFYKNYSTSIESNSIIESLINKLVKKHLEFMIEEKIMSHDQDEFFFYLHKELNDISRFFKIDINMLE